VILAIGSVPLPVLEQRMAQFIAEEEKTPQRRRRDQPADRRGPSDELLPLRSAPREIELITSSWFDSLADVVSIS
jgi:hypothetical protein